MVNDPGEVVASRCYGPSAPIGITPTPSGLSQPHPLATITFP